MARRVTRTTVNTAIYYHDRAERFKRSKHCQTLFYFTEVSSPLVDIRESLRVLRFERTTRVAENRSKIESPSIAASGESSFYARSREAASLPPVDFDFQIRETTTFAVSSAKKRKEERSEYLTRRFSSFVYLYKRGVA